MFWITFGTIIFLLFFAAIIFIFIHDRRFEKKSTLETMRKETFDEIQMEREKAMIRAEKFKKNLSKM